MHVRLARIVQAKTVSSGSDAEIGPFLFWGQPLLLQDGYLWSQLQRPRRLTFPRRISDWVKSPRSSRQPWSLVGVGTSFGASTIHTHSPCRLTLRCTKGTIDVGGGHGLQGSRIRHCRSSPQQCPDRNSLLAEAQGHRLTGRGPSSVPPTTCLGHQHLLSRCLPMAFCLCRDARGAFPAPSDPGLPSLYSG